MPVIGTLLGKAIFGKDAFGRRPDVPALTPIDPNKVRSDTIAGNQAALSGAQSLASSVNEFNTAQQLGVLARSLNFLAPGGFEKFQSMIGDQLSGVVPKDVAAQVRRNTVAQSFGSGFAGSQLGRNLTARDLGLTSLSLMQRGLENLKAFTPNTPLMDVTSMFYTPQQRLQFAFQDRESQFNRDWRAAQVKAAPDPFAAAMTQAIIQDEQAILEIAGNVVGMAAGACWIARAVFGEHDIRWRLVRVWLFTEAPAWFRDFYLTHGAKLAKHVNAKTRAQLFGPMNRIAMRMARRYFNSATKGDTCPVM